MRWSSPPVAADHSIRVPKVYSLSVCKKRTRSGTITMSAGRKLSASVAQD